MLLAICLGIIVSAFGMCFVAVKNAGGTVAGGCVIALPYVVVAVAGLGFASHRPATRILLGETACIAALAMIARGLLFHATKGDDLALIGVSFLEYPAIVIALLAASCVYLADAPQ
jgi:hypothetical protein